MYRTGLDESDLNASNLLSSAGRRVVDSDPYISALVIVGA